MNITDKELRMLLSLSKEALRFTSGRGTFETRRAIQAIEDRFIKEQEMIENKLEFLLLPIQVPKGYSVSGVSQKDGEYTLHLKKETSVNRS